MVTMLQHLSTLLMYTALGLALAIVITVAIVYSVKYKVYKKYKVKIGDHAWMYTANGGGVYVTVLRVSQDGMVVVRDFFGFPHLVSRDKLNVYMK